ncbi:hypothetical protein [Candidatus Methanoperedens nitratireducens]|uniref:hypothetical protein n=1 Tax=Candidatus Methanoperedens nitratireducens TaxID=1392998 RepID=UPI0015C87918|nr:hypothetical protein [Candidatus Methanoperedens nitroreducens]
MSVIPPLFTPIPPRRSTANERQAQAARAHARGRKRHLTAKSAKNAKRTTK